MRLVRTRNITWCLVYIRTSPYRVRKDTKGLSFHREKLRSKSLFKHNTATRVGFSKLAANKLEKMVPKLRNFTRTYEMVTQQRYM